MEQEEQELYHAAVELIKKRYPRGWGGAAAVRTETGKILTSIAPDTKNDALSLCMEVGAFLEAHKLNEKVTHSLCIGGVGIPREWNEGGLEHRLCPVAVVDNSSPT